MSWLDCTFFCRYYQCVIFAIVQWRLFWSVDGVIEDIYFIIDPNLSTWIMQITFVSYLIYWIQRRHLHALWAMWAKKKKWKQNLLDDSNKCAFAVFRFSQESWFLDSLNIKLAFPPLWSTCYSVFIFRLHFCVNTSY